MAAIDAIYQNGVFRPLEDVPFAENERVRLSVQTMDRDDARSWLERVRQRQQRILARRGHFSDSALEIAEDRQR